MSITRLEGRPVKRALFLGCGVAARTHARILRRAGVELHFASRDLARAEAFRKEWKGAGAFGSYERAVEADVDLVVVTTPTASHRDLTLLALEAGKRVVVEKPAFMHAADADVVAATAASRGLRVLVAENYAYKPMTRRLREMIVRGDLGEVRFVSINATKRQRAEGWRADPALAGGGALFEGGVHWVSFAASLGLEVESAQGFPTGDASSALVVLRYANGAVGTLAYSWELAAPLGGLRLSKIQGTAGAVTFESNGFAFVGSGGARGARLLGLGDPRGVKAMWADFLQALATGAEPEFTLAMARRDLRLLEEAGAAATLPSSPGTRDRASIAR